MEGNANAAQQIVQGIAKGRPGSFRGCGTVRGNGSEIRLQQGERLLRSRQIPRLQGVGQ